jgi:hypothetical protein
MNSTRKQISNEGMEEGMEGALLLCLEILFWLNFSFQSGN